MRCRVHCDSIRLLEEGRRTLGTPCGYAIRRPPREAIRVVRTIKEDLAPPLTIAIGDVVTRNISRYDSRPDVSVIDLKTQREPTTFEADLAEHYDISLRCRNPPGSLTAEAWGSVALAILLALSGKHVLVVVDGEEDLLAIPAVLTAPERSLIVYGLRDEALVALPVTRYLKESLRRFIARSFAALVGEA